MCHSAIVTKPCMLAEVIGSVLSEKWQWNNLMWIELGRTELSLAYC